MVHSPNQLKARFSSPTLWMGRGWWGALAVLLIIPCSLGGSEPATKVVRWASDAPNCTLRQGADGRTYYEMLFGHIRVVVALDSHELEKIPRRAIPMLALSVSFKLDGPGQFAIRQRQFSLEFVKHHNVVKTALAPAAMLASLQQDINDLTYEVEHHEVKRHPEQKPQKEAELQARLKEYTEMMDFISSEALRPSEVDRSRPTVSGWVFFSVEDRWIGPWKKPEQFVLRIPAIDSVLEFPLVLPSQSNKIELRRRSGD